MLPLYLDNAATSFPKPASVCDAVDRWMRTGFGAHGRTAGSASDSSQRIVEQTRVRVADLLGISSPDRVAFTFNCTDSLNLVLRGFLRPGHRVITTTLEHNSVLRPLRQLQQEMELDVAYVDFDPSSGEIDVDDLRTALRHKESHLVVMTHASNVLGTVQPIATASREAHEAGALILLDAAQTAGHQPLKMQELNVDFLATAGHKGMLGPTGTGILAVRSELESRLRPARCGGTGTQSERPDQPDTMPELFESGNMNMPGLCGLHAATAWLQERGITEIARQITSQTTELRNELRTIPEIDCYPADLRQDTSGIVSFNVRGTDCREVATILDQAFGIVCRAGLHCAPLVHQTLGTLAAGGTVRLSPGPFTTAEDIRQTVEAVRQIAAAF
ncbi:MAG: aminotransferase class V-fold PLP-dependent enzyme [Planctomycetaceae bacterium]|nr:aminotransferase class V-fold PLP-dependent enzyme [Planctomycetaceae bacterium]